MREEILGSLSDGEFVSGAKLAKKLGVSRVAIWKHIQDLRKDGYTIESRPKLGYRLIDSPDLLYPYEIRGDLGTEFVGRRILYRESVSSTQEVAKGLAAQGGEEGTLVVAEEQTAGKGRRGRNWSSPRGGIYLSIILKPEIPPARASAMALLAGLAAGESIGELYGLDVELKWPNDIQIGDRKVGGVLIEISAEAEVINWLVMGVGLNANNEVASLPGDLCKQATSIREEHGRPVSRVKLLRKLLEKVEELYLGFKEEGSANILEKWREMTNTLEVQVRVSDGETIEGRAVDVDRDGSLIIECPDGSLERVVAGDVSLRRTGKA